MLNDEDIKAMEMVLRRAGDLDPTDSVLGQVNSLVARYKTVLSKITLLQQAIGDQAKRLGEAAEHRDAAFAIIGRLVTAGTLDKRNNDAPTLSD